MVDVARWDINQILVKLAYQMKLDFENFVPVPSSYYNELSIDTEQLNSVENQDVPLLPELGNCSYLEMKPNQDQPEISSPRVVSENGFSSNSERFLETVVSEGQAAHGVFFSERSVVYEGNFPEEERNYLTRSGNLDVDSLFSTDDLFLERSTFDNK